MRFYTNLLEEFKSWFYGYATLAIIAQSCLGSISAMSILKNGNDFSQMIQLSIVVILCMLVNGTILAQMKPKVVLNLLITSILFSTLFIIWNLI